MRLLVHATRETEMCAVEMREFKVEGARRPHSSKRVNYAFKYISKAYCPEQRNLLPRKLGRPFKYFKNPGVEDLRALSGPSIGPYFTKA